MTPRGVTKSLLRDKMTNVKHIMLFQNQFKKKTATLKPNLNFKKGTISKKVFIQYLFFNGTCWEKPFWERKHNV